MSDQTPPMWMVDIIASEISDAISADGCGEAQTAERIRARASNCATYITARLFPRVKTAVT